MMLTGYGSRFSQVSFPSKHLFWVIYIFLLELSGSDESIRKSGDNTNAVWQSRKQVRHDLAPPIFSQNTFPQFRSPSMKFLVQKGDRILLPCVVHDLGEDHILWRHQANILAGSNVSSYSDHSGRIRLFENFTLEISGVSAADEGEYECFLASPESSLKLVHTVTVQDPPSVSVLPAKGSVIVIEGETVQIGCIPHGKPKPRITWSKREGPIPWNHLKLYNESIITMERVSRKHTGLYVCAADNGIGRPALGAVYVRVLHAPEVEVPKRRVHGGVHYRAQLICIVHADPKPEVQWLLGQKPVPLSERILAEARDKEYTLTINSVRESDFGMYICTANNSYGYDLRHVEFSGVPNAPVVSRWETLPLSAAAVAVGQAKAEEARVENSSHPKLNENADDKAGDFSSELQNDVQVQLLWAVECYSPLIDYRLAFRPAPTKPLTSQNEDKTPLWTELTIPADYSSTFLHTKSFLVRGLQRQTIYESAIKARNKYGWSPISSVFYFSTFPNSTSKNPPVLREYITENETPEETDDGQGNLTTHPALLGRQNESWPKSHLSLSTGSGASGIHRSIPSFRAQAFNNLFSSSVAITITVMTALHISNGWHHHPMKSI